MNRILLWLEENRAISVVLVLGYFFLVVLPHKRFGTWINRFFLSKNGTLQLTIPEYNKLIAGISTTVLVIASIVLFKALRKNQEWKKVIFYLISSVVFAVILIKTMFFINIEMVHFPQYAFLAILIFPLSYRYQSALIWATIAGTLDEGYQYFYLAPDETGYFDFNDVVTNLIGATFGLIILKALDIREKQVLSFFKRSEVLGLISLTTILVILYLMKVWSIHPTEGVPFPIVQKELTSFWTEAAHNVTYHVMRPFEALIIVPSLWIYYRWLR